MAVTKGALTTSDEIIGSGTNREDLGKILWLVSPDDTPGLDSMGKTRATAIWHDWVEDKLKSAQHIGALEGEDADPVKRDPRTRVRNNTQIVKDHAVVSGTQEVVQKGGGVTKESMRQMVKIAREMKTHVEFSMFGRNGPKRDDNGTDEGRYMASLSAYLGGGSYQGTGAAPTGDGDDVPGAGTDRALDEAIFKAGLQQLWQQSGGNRNVIALCGGHQRGVISSFQGADVRYVTTDDARLQASIDVYDGDYHVVTVRPDRFCLTKNVFIIDKEYIACADLRPIQSKDLAVTGDSVRKEVLWETTLEVRNREAHVNIADLEDGS